MTNLDLDLYIYIDIRRDNQVRGSSQYQVLPSQTQHLPWTSGVQPAQNSKRCYGLGQSAGNQKGFLESMMRVSSKISLKEKKWTDMENRIDRSWKKQLIMICNRGIEQKGTRTIKKKNNVLWRQRTGQQALDMCLRTHLSFWCTPFWPIPKLIRCFEEWYWVRKKWDLVVNKLDMIQEHALLWDQEKKSDKQTILCLVNWSKHCQL